MLILARDQTGDKGTGGAQLSCPSLLLKHGLTCTGLALNLLCFKTPGTLCTRLRFFSPVENDYHPPKTNPNHDTNNGRPPPQCPFTSCGLPRALSLVHALSNALLLTLPVQNPQLDGNSSCYWKAPAPVTQMRLAIFTFKCVTTNLKWAHNASWQSHNTTSPG